MKAELVQLHAAPQGSASPAGKLLEAGPPHAAELEASAPEAVKLRVPDAPARGVGMAELQTEQPSAPVAISSQTWLERLQESFVKLILGWIMLIFSIPILWFNERRNARMESLIARASSEARTVDADSKEKESQDCLVHVKNAHMHGVGEVRHTEFDVAMPGGCIRLQSDVEVFQHNETQRPETRQRLGGGQETITHFEYSEDWSRIWHSSASFQDKSKVNTKPEGLDLGMSTVNCDNVEYGAAFRLPGNLVEQCSNWMPAHKIVGASVSLAGGSGGNRVSVRRSSTSAARFVRGAADYYYMRPGDLQWKGEGPTRVGDARVRFRYVPDGDATVLALRAAGEPRDTFLPYRLVFRGWLGRRGLLAALGPDQEEEQKRTLRQEAEKDAKQLAADSSCGGGLLCCACSLVTMCFSAVMTPEIFHLWEADMNLAACLKNVSERNETTTWLVRVAGWVIMFVGLFLTFSPLLTLVVAIPFLGPILSNFGAWLIWVLCLVTTLLVSSIIVILAYLAYHPMKALLYAALAAGICMATVLASRALAA